MKRRLFFIIIMILSASSFYNPMGLINRQTAMLLFYASSMILIIDSPHITLRKIKGFPTTCYWVILWGMAGAVLMATIFQNQSFLTSVIAVFPYFFAYLSLIVFFKSGISKPQIIRLIFALATSSIVIYIVNTLTFPIVFFRTIDVDNVDDSRGMLRLGVSNIELFIFILLYGIDRWHYSKKKMWIAIIVICGVMIVFSLTRQIILISVIIGIIYLLKKVVWYKKCFYIGLFSLFFIYVLPEIPIYKAMVEVSENQLETVNTKQDDPRIRCFKFYTDGYQTNGMTRFFGNGVPSIGNSSWGNQFEMKSRTEGAYPSDLGWIGFYWYFGLVSTVGLFLFLLKSASYNMKVGNEYFSYYIISIMLLAILSGPIIYPSQIVNTMLIIYWSFIGKKDIYANNGQTQENRCYHS